MPTTPVTRAEFDKVMTRMRRDKNVLLFFQILFGLIVSVGVYFAIASFFKARDYEQSRIIQLQKTVDSVLLIKKDFKEIEQGIRTERLIFQGIETRIGTSLRNFETALSNNNNETDEKVEEVRNHTDAERSQYFESLTRDYFDK